MEVARLFIAVPSPQAKLGRDLFGGRGGYLPCSRAYFLLLSSVSFSVLHSRFRLFAPFSFLPLMIIVFNWIAILFKLTSN